MERKTRKMSDEQKAKISKSLTGKKRTDEQRANISKGRKGIKLSEEHKQSISDALKVYWESIPTGENKY